jgi:hypothetical protein
MEKSALQVAIEVGQAIERCGGAYFLGGSLASSLQGEPRSTNDVDLVTDLSPERVADFAQTLGPEFDVDEESLADELRRRRSWNIFHLPTALKIDLFAVGVGPFDRSEFGRRRQLTVGGRGLWVKSPEDTVLRKLLWYRSGGEVSTTQWRDVVSVLRLSSGALHDAYLDQWAASLGVADLLARARAEAASAR